MELFGVSIWTVVFAVLISCSAFIYDVYSHRESKAVSLKNASAWSIFYVIIALVMAAWLYVIESPEYASLFLTGYTLEKVLAVDNLLVFSLIFAYFNVPDKFQHKILHWGILGAVLFRLVFVVIGASLLNMFGPWVELFFAAFIIYTVYLMLTSDEDDETEYENMLIVKLAKKVFPVNTNISSGKFFISGMMTPLFITLLVVEISDIMFAFDSVPAVLAVTQVGFLVYISIIFAIFGLRQIYFVLSALKRFLVHLEKAVIAILLYIGLKLAAHSLSSLAIKLGLLDLDAPLKVDSTTSLVIVLVILSMGVVASLIWPEKHDS